MTQREPRRRSRRVLAVGIGALLAIGLFELVLQIGAFALWQRGGREVAADGAAAVVLCVGSVVLNVAGAVVLNATAGDALVAGVPANSLTGVPLYVLMCGAALLVAAAPHIRS